MFCFSGQTTLLPDGVRHPVPARQEHLPPGLEAGECAPVFSRRLQESFHYNPGIYISFEILWWGWERNDHCGIMKISGKQIKKREMKKKNIALKTG